jgi:RNA polymerase sigma-54 factor
MQLTSSQNQRMQQTQVLSPQMRESLRILQMSSLDLITELKHQIDTNPVIEPLSNSNESPISSVEESRHSSGAITENELDFTPTGEAADKMLSTDDGYRDYFLGNMENFQGEDDSSKSYLFDSQQAKLTLQEYLLSQLSLSDIQKEDIPLAQTLIGNINDYGYFEGSIPDIQMTSGTSEKKIFEILEIIKSLDPKGCGSRSLKECLLSQMDKFEDSPWEDEIRLLVEKHIDNMSARKVSVICKDLNISESDYPKLLAEFKKFSANPSDEFNAAQSRATPLAKSNGVYQLKNPSIPSNPDIYVLKKSSGGWLASPLPQSFPRIRISSDYEEMMKKAAAESDEKKYLITKIEEARILQEALSRRKETIMIVAQEILDRQLEFLEHGWDRLKPLTMIEVAKALDITESTVSRAVNGKYIKTPFGTVELKKLFVTGIATQSGEAVSNTAILNRIEKIVSEEDKTKPLSDEQIMKILNDGGIPVKRRTVAKYRTTLNIPSASQRKIR